MYDCELNRTWIGNFYCSWEKGFCPSQSWAVVTRRPMLYTCLTRKWVCLTDTRQNLSGTYMHTWGTGQGLQQSSTTTSQKQEDHGHKATVVHKKNRLKHYPWDATIPLSARPANELYEIAVPHRPVMQVQVDEACSVKSPVQCVNSQNIYM